MAQVSCRGTCGCGVYVVDEIVGSRISTIMMENADFVVATTLGPLGQAGEWTIMLHLTVCVTVETVSSATAA